MELRYRGVSYQASTVAGQATETDQMGVYRGVPYHPRAAKGFLYQPAEELVYRGVRYIR